MENLHYNLSEEEFSKGRKNLLWGFTILFFLAGMYVLFVSLVLGRKSMPAILAAAPLGITVIVGIIATFASIKRKDLFFIVDDEKIEFRYGLLKARKHSFKWIDVSELIMPQKQKKAKLLFKDGSSFVINLTWIQRKKSSIIRKHIYLTAREKGLLIKKPAQL